MTDHTRDPATGQTGPGHTTERVVHTNQVRERGTPPATGFIVGGLVVAVAIIPYIVFGDTGFRDTGQVNMPPAVENTINTAPAAGNAPPADTGAAGQSDTSGGASATPPAPEGSSAN